MDRAVVVGASIAGLLAARVLTDHADEVVLVERDDLGGGPEPRRGVPQGRQVHAVLTRGLTLMEGSFPGVTAEMVDAGGVAGDPGVECHWYVDGRRKPAAPVGRGISCTRPFLEWNLRRRLLALPGVRLVQARVQGLTTTAHGARVDGVRLGDADGQDDERFDADLVVDCTGRSSRMATWLSEIGYGPPPELGVKVDLGYASRFFRRAPDDRIDGAQVVVSLTDDVRRARGAVASAVENDRWMVTVGGYHHDRPTADVDDFAARVDDDPTVALRRFARGAEPLGDVATHRYPASVRREFHRLPRLPGGLIALGDSVASFNPIYGQGMTSAAMQADVLARYLRAGVDPRQPAAGYFKGVRPVVNAVWQLSASADFRLAHVRGDKPRGLWALHRVTALYTHATLRDAASHQLFLRVLNLEQPPSALMRPTALVRAVGAARRPLP